MNQIVSDLKTQKTKIADLTINGYENDYIYNVIKQNGNFYEIDLLQKWFPAVEGARVILDIGSNIGNHSLFWATNLDNIKIYAFEPFKANWHMLMSNVSDNALEEKIIPINRGIGRKNTYANLASIDVSNLGGATFEENTTKTDDSIEIYSIDELTKIYNLKNIDFVKIDTEGFEIPVLEGMKKTITKYFPVIWVEVSYESYQKVCAFMNTLGYEVVDILGFNYLFYPPKKPVNIEKYDYDRLIDDRFIYLKKFNFYYGAYTKAKEWVEASNQKKDSALQSWEKEKNITQQLHEKLIILNEENSKLKTQIQNYTAQNQSLTAKVEAGNKLQQQTNQKLETFNNENQQLHAKVEIYYNEKEELKNKFEVSNNENQQLKVKQELYEQEKTETIKKLEKYSIEVQHLQITLNTIIQEKESYQTNLDELKKDKKLLESVIQTITQQNQFLESDLQGLNQENEVLKQNIETFKREIKELTLQLENINNEVTIFTKNLDTKNHENSELAELLSLKENNIRNLYLQIDQMEKDYKEWILQLTHTLKSNIQIFKETRAKINHLQNENNDYKRKFSKITDTWYGKIMLKTYRITKRIYKKLIR